MRARVWRWLMAPALGRLETWFARRGFLVAVRTGLSGTPWDTQYVGGLRDGGYLAWRGIRPELAQAEHSVCSIGFCERDARWYGWSHRAMASFGVGQRLTEEDDLIVSEALPVGFVARSTEDARRLAVAFAESVS